MTHRYIIGLFFLIGMVCGFLLSGMFSDFVRIKVGIGPGWQQRQPLSHDDIDLVLSDQLNTTSDKHFHNDNTSVADELYKSVRVLIWVMTSQNNLYKKAIHVRATWGRRPNKILYMSDSTDKNFPAIGISSGKGRAHLTAKTMNAFDYIWKHHSEEAEWFMKVDDDTYVIVENLRYLLSSHNPTESIYFGHHFKPYVKQGYFSGGGGYVMSKEALRRFAGRSKFACSTDYGAEDVEIGKCMESLGVKTGDSRDKLGRSRFHCFNPQTHIHGGYPDWYLSYDKYGAHKGIDSMSDYPITFHYISTEQMYELEFFTYHLHPYGIVTQDAALNRQSPKMRELKFSKQLHHQRSGVATKVPALNRLVPKLRRNETETTGKKAEALLKRQGSR